MRSQAAKSRRRLISTAFASSVVWVGGWASAADLHGVAPSPVVSKPATPPSVGKPTPAQPLAPAQPATPAQPAVRPGQSGQPAVQPVQTPVQTQARTHQGDGRNDHDRGGERRGRIVILPWWGYASGPEGWNNGEGWNTDTGTNNSTFSDTSVPSSNLNTAAPTTVPSTPSVVGTTAIITNSVDKSPEMIAANNEVQIVQAEYDRERGRVLGQLRDKPQYNRAAQQRDAAAADLNTAKSTPTTQPAITDAAVAKLDASSEVTKMEEQAIAADKDAAAANARLTEVVAKRDALRAKMLAQH